MISQKGKAEWLYGYRMVVSVSADDPRGHMADWKLHLLTLANLREDHPVYHSLKKDKNSRFEVCWFLLNVYCFCTTVSLKNSKLCHCKSGAICTDNYRDT